jgi:broad specificity phosphatase PhoE
VYTAHKEEFGVDPMVHDVPLTSKGQEQALSVIAKLSMVTQSFGGLDDDVRVVSSPLLRALETPVLARPEGAGRIDL